MAAIAAAARGLPIQAANRSAKKTNSRQMNNPTNAKVAMVTRKIRRASRRPWADSESAADTRMEIATGSPAVDSKKKKE